MAVIGTNGSGKSTLAKHFNVLLLPTAGTCEICGMVRNMAGGFVDLGLHRITVQRFAEILEGLDRTKLGATAPAQGLCLEEVFYSEETLQRTIEHLQILEKNTI